MKKAVISSFLLCLVFSLILPAAVGLCFPLTEPEESEDEPGELIFSPNDSLTTIRLLNGDQVEELTMDEYLIGAVAAEMPASFEPEALKAQAVALRTYAVYKKELEPERHADADICSDPTCCAAWADETFLREKWGEDYELYYNKIAEAVAETDSLYLTYEGEPVLAAFHSSSDGYTESSSEVWGSALPYLVSVSTPEDSESVPNFTSSVTMSHEEFKNTFLEAYPEADFEKGLPEAVTGLIYDVSGRLSRLSVGGIEISGTTLRSVFSLRSTAITMSFDEDTVTITTSGYGHGVGMSQYGANVMAKNGADFEEILANYYPGTLLSQM